MYSYSPDLANAAYQQGRNTSGALKRLIGVNASNLVSIDADALGARFGGKVGIGIAPTAILDVDNGTSTNPIFIARDNGTAVYSILDGGNVEHFGLVSKYNNVVTGGWGFAAILNYGNVAAQTAAAVLAAYSVVSANGSFEVSANVLITTSITHSFGMQVSYTDELNIARVLILPMAQLSGAFVAGGLITNVTGAGPYHSAILPIRCKYGTTITVLLSAGDYTSVVYNAEAFIKRVA